MVQLAPPDALTLAVEFVNSARRQMLRARNEEPRCVWMSSQLWKEIMGSQYLPRRDHWRTRCAVYPPAAPPQHTGGRCELVGVEVRFSDDPRRDPAFDGERDLVLPTEFVGTPAIAPRVDG